MKKILFIILLLSSACGFAQNANDAISLYNKANHVFTAIESSNSYTEFLNTDDLMELPVGIKKTMNNIEYTIAISSAVFHENYAEITAFARIKSIKGQDLIFGVSGLKFSFEGGFEKGATLALLGDFAFPIPGKAVSLVLKGGLNMANGQMASNSTYITIDCEGFKELFVNADLEFSQDIFIPCNEKGDKIENEKLRTNLNLQVTNVADILIGIDIPKFQIKGLDDVVFTVRNAVFDFSDTKNDVSMTFPQGYESKYLTFPSLNLWQGVYIRELEVLIPRSFKKTGSQDRIGFGAHDMLIDNNGVSGDFFAKGILPLKEGDASGWAFSVDEFALKFEANTLTAARFNGAIAIPLAERDTLRYNALITSDNEYDLTVEPMGELNFDIWQAKVVLDNNSFLKLRVVDNQFRPEANLNGYMSLNLKNNPKDQSADNVAKLDKIVFQNLYLRTEMPYISVDYFGYQGEITLGNLPASITEIALQTKGNVISLNVAGKVTLSQGDFSAGAGIGIEIERVSDGRDKWKFKRLRLDKLYLKGTIAIVELEGQLEFMDGDPVYGNGFKGEISLKIEEIGIAINARAIFGKRSYNYWFVHGSATFPPIGSGMFNVHGFSGGAYYQMCRLSNRDDYVPDSTMGLGLRAGVMFDIAKPEVVDCMAELELAFNKGKGLRYISLFGSAQIMSKLSLGGGIASLEGYSNNLNNSYNDKLSKIPAAEKEGGIDKIKEDRERNSDAAAKESANTALDPRKVDGLAAFLAIKYDFKNKCFHATFDTYVNVAGGLLRGVNANNLAGTAVIHIEPSDWYIHVGTPTAPMGVMIGIGDLSVKSTTYFMAGKSIPEPPPPPEEVVDILGLGKTNQAFNRNNSLLAGGRGLAFGARFSLNTGDITFLLLYAKLSAGMGFDITMTQNKDVYCEGSDKPIGINGWYARGQAYAYLAGEFGVKVNLLFISGKYTILKGGAAAMFQASLPKPTFMRGYVGLQYDILNGLVKGRAKFEIELGKECVMEKRGDGSPLDDIEIISDIKPANNSEVDVFSSPQVAFNFALDKEFALQDDAGNDIAFRMKLEKFTLSSKGRTIDGELIFDETNERVTFNSFEVLPPQSSIQLNVEVSFLEKKNGVWAPVKKNGNIVKEAKTVNFTTSDAPKEIPLHNIEYCYPVVSQRNYYRDETKEGYIQLKKGQSYLFNIEGQTQSLAIQSFNSAETIESPFKYNSTERQLTFTMPTINASTDYTLSIVSKLSGNSTANTSANAISQTIGSDENTFEIRQNQAQLGNRTDIGITLLTYDFHTSVYETFARKINALTVSNYYTGYINYHLFNLQFNLNQYEPFDLVELVGNEYTENVPLVTIMSDLKDNRYVDYMYPVLYQHFPYPEGITITGRDTVIYGVPPKRAFLLKEQYINDLKSDNYTSSTVTRQFPYIYDLFTVYEEDYYEIGNHLANKFIGRGNIPEYIKYILQWGLTSIPKNSYGVTLQYIFPNKKSGSAANMKYQSM